MKERMEDFHELCGNSGMRNEQLGYPDSWASNPGSQTTQPPIPSHQTNWLPCHPGSHLLAQPSCKFTLRRRAWAVPWVAGWLGD